MKRFLPTALLSLMLATAAAQAQVYVRIGPPPPPREAVVVRPGPHYMWVPGYYRWEGRRYIWQPGAWVLPPRPGYHHWVPGHWAHSRDGYYSVEGHWR